MLIKWLRIAPERLMQTLPRLRNRHFLLGDALLLVILPALALAVRLDSMRMLPHYAADLLVYTLAALVVRVVVFHAFGLYNRYWRYADVDELYQICLGVFVSSLPIALVFYSPLRVHMPGEALPRSIPLVDSMLVLLAVGGSRFSVRLAERKLRLPAGEKAKPVLIVGAGIAGQMIARELQSNPQHGVTPLGFLDDDLQKHGVRIMDLPVLGGRERLGEMVRRHGITQVIIAMPRASGKVIREVLHRCEKAGVPARTVPAMGEILSGAVSATQLRKVEIEDLLRREPVRTDIEAVRAYLRGKRVLVTGGGGSIGSELCRQILRCGPEELALLGHGENSIFETVSELNRQLRTLAHDENGRPLPTVQGIIADTRFPERIRKLVRDLRPHVIFHTAAHKHVPLMEANVSEAVTNNIFGTQNLLDAALAAGVERFVMISSDKAVNPTSVMGASKRAAELLVLQAARESGKPYVAVRFGNVLGSRGSVLLTFRRQIAEGGPVTVSDPEMTRYFMTIPEAVQLVLQAAVLGSSGEIFVLDMGDPVRILDLARDLIELSGLEEGHDIDIVYSGVRPGEKLYEELFVEGERYEPTHHEKILIARNASSFIPDGVGDVLRTLEQAAQRDDAPVLVAALKELIPEFAHESSVRREAGAQEGPAGTSRPG